ncbi:MAG TPA: LysE family translocator [Methylomirabilota bacterium]|nr:LysE family translocator [Methylomirabilota bacterium]
MPSSDLLIPFFVATAIFACVPGPGMFYAAAQTMALGRRAGWYSAAGFHIAGFAHIAAAALGVSVLLQVTPGLFAVMKLAGAAYLIWLGVRYLVGRAPLIAPGGVGPGRAAGKALRDSIVAELLNPKSAVFYFAFLPQFTDATADFPVWMQIVVLGAVVNTMFTVTDAVLIEVAHAAMTTLKESERVALLVRRVGGGVLVALGVNLALARQ